MLHIPSVAKFSIFHHNSKCKIFILNSSIILFREEGIRRVWEPGANLLSQDIFSTLIYESTYAPEQILRRPNPPEIIESKNIPVTGATEVTIKPENAENIPEQSQSLDIFDDMPGLNTTVEPKDKLTKRHNVLNVKSNLTKSSDEHLENVTDKEEFDQVVTEDEDDLDAEEIERDKKENVEDDEKKSVLILTCTGLLAACLLSIGLCFSHKVNTRNDLKIDFHYITCSYSMLSYPLF